MNNSKRQTLAMIGIVLLVIAGVLVYVAWSQPRVYVETTVEEAVTEQVATVEQTTASQNASNNVTVVVSSKPQVNYPVNLNTATYDELVSIDGVGEARASLILQYRDEIGGYTSVEQIKNISGIGDAIYAQIAPYLTV